MGDPGKALCDAEGVGNSFSAVRRLTLVFLNYFSPVFHVKDVMLLKGSFQCVFGL